jgi:SAM-dependent methyltransferase
VECYDVSAEYYDVVRGITPKNLVEVTALLEGERALAFLDHYHFDHRKCFLDVGCGTGNLCCYLGFLGHHVLGVDCSAGMIRVASMKKETYNLPTTRFLQKEAGELSSADIGAEVGFVYAKELLNNVLSPEGCGRICSALYSVMPSGTTLLMESFTELGVGFLVDRSARQYSGFHFSQGGSYDPASRTGVVEYEFRPDDQAKPPVMSTLRVRYWDMDEYRDLLHHAGFRKVEFYDANVQITCDAAARSLSFAPVSFLSETFLVKAEKV